MTRLVIADHGFDLFVQGHWLDGHGNHMVRCTEDLPADMLAKVRGIIVARPDIIRWELDRPKGSKLAIGIMREGDTGPLFNVNLPQAVKQDADALMSWWDDMVETMHRPQNDRYEEERALIEEDERLQKRRKRLEELA